jgi:O-acetyl-ADP-ribose deacetylase (regulator of RNase III)
VLSLFPSCLSKQLLLLNTNNTNNTPEYRTNDLTFIMTIIPVEEIPTVSLLYHLKKLVPAEIDPEASEIAPTPSQSFNDRIGLIRGDITKLEVDAIVNAANRSLLGGGGVDGAIHRAAGPELYDECETLDGCETGSAKITGAYRLPSKKIIHAVGPVYHYDDIETVEEALASCYATSLKLAVENGCKSIAFSALSTGIYGYPSDEAAPVAIRAVKEFLEGEDGAKLEKVIFTTFVQKDVNAYNKWLP